MAGIKRYFRSTKKSSNTKRQRRAAPTKNVRTVKALTRRRTKRRTTGTRTRSTRKSLASRVPVVRSNLQTLILDNNDSFAVAVPSGTAGSVNNAGKACIYGFVGCTSQGGIHESGLLDLGHMKQMAISLESGQSYNVLNNGNETKMSIIDCFQTSELINNSNTIANLTSFKVMCRNDIAQNGSNNYQNLYNIIGQGFYQRSFGTTAYGANEGLSDAELSLFDSHKFCSEFKIMAVKQTKLDPGATCKFSITARNKVVNWNHYSTITNLTNGVAGSTLDYSHRRGAMMWIHKLEGTPAVDTAGDQCYSLPKIRMITKTHYNFVQVNPSEPIITKINAAGYSNIGSNNIQIMNDETGVQSNEVQV